MVLSEVLQGASFSLTWGETQNHKTLFRLFAFVLKFIAALVDLVNNWKYIFNTYFNFM